MARKKLNRIKVVLVDKDFTNKMLADKINKTPITVSRWCTNEVQPSVEVLYSIAEILDVDIFDLLESRFK